MNARRAALVAATVIAVALLTNTGVGGALVGGLITTTTAVPQPVGGVVDTLDGKVQPTTTMTVVEGATTSTSTSTTSTTQPAADSGPRQPTGGDTGTRPGTATPSAAAGGPAVPASGPAQAAAGSAAGVTGAATGVVAPVAQQLPGVLSQVPNAGPVAISPDSPPLPDLLLDGAFALPDGRRSTAAVLAALERGGRVDVARLARLLVPFPVAGPAYYGDEWGVSVMGALRLVHQGIDIGAPAGTPVVAAADGKLEHLSEVLVGGRSVDLAAEDGTRYGYGALDRLAPFLYEGSWVSKGDLIGFVGGADSAGNGHHLYFEIHPGGGAAVSPIPYLDRWLADALRRVEGRSGASTPQASGGQTSTGGVGRFFRTSPAGRFAALRPVTSAAGQPVVVAMVLAPIVIGVSKLRSRRRTRQA